MRILGGIGPGLGLIRNGIIVKIRLRVGAIRQACPVVRTFKAIEILTCEATRFGEVSVGDRKRDHDCGPRSLEGGSSMTEKNLGGLKRWSKISSATSARRK